MSFPIRRVDVDPGTCERCAGETHCVNEEHVDDVAGIPLARKFMWFSRCRTCGAVDHRRDAEAGERMGLTPGVRTWITATWSILAVIGVALAVCGIWSTIRERANGLSPVVGDEWSISRDQWREKFTGDVSMNSVPRAQLDAIYQEAIEDVDSSRDDHEPVYVGFGIAASLLFLWRIIGQHWKKRVAIADF